MLALHVPKKAGSKSVTYEVLWGWFLGDQECLAWKSFTTLRGAQRRYRAVKDIALWCQLRRLTKVLKESKADEDAQVIPEILLATDKFDSKGLSDQDAQDLVAGWAAELLKQFPRLYYSSPALTPTPFIPATPEKVDEMRRRRARGQDLFHKDDASDLVGVARIHDAKRRNGRHSFRKCALVKRTAA